MANPNNLKVITTSEEGRRLAALSVEARRRRAQERRDEARQFGALAHVLKDLGVAELSGLALKRFLAQLVAGEVVIPPSKWPEMMKVLHDVSLLELGRATSITEKLDKVDLSDELATLVAQLRSGRRVPLEVPSTTVHAEEV